MNKRETFYFTDEELEMLQLLGWNRKTVKEKIHKLLVYETKDLKEKARNIQKIIRAKWIIDNED